MKTTLTDRTMLIQWLGNKISSPEHDFKTKSKQPIVSPTRHRRVDGRKISVLKQRQKLNERIQNCRFPLGETRFVYGANNNDLSI